MLESKSQLCCHSVSYCTRNASHGTHSDEMLECYWSFVIKLKATTYNTWNHQHRRKQPQVHAQATFANIMT